MKHYILGAITSIAILTLSVSFADAHMMMGEGGGEITHEQEMAQGGMLYQKMQSREMSCANATDQDFELMGEYFMGQTMPMADHDIMNDRLEAMMGHDGEEMVHANIGRHGSNCDTATASVEGNMMNGDYRMTGMNMDGSGMNTQGARSTVPSPAVMLLLWVFAIIGMVSVAKKLLTMAQKKDVAAPTAPEIKK